MSAHCHCKLSGNIRVKGAGLSLYVELEITGMYPKEVSFVSDDKIDSLLEFFLISREEVIGGEARVPPSILRRIPNGKFHLVVEGQRVAQSLTIPKIYVLLFWTTAFPFASP